MQKPTKTQKNTRKRTKTVQNDKKKNARWRMLMHCHDLDGFPMQGKEGINPFPGTGVRRLGEPSTRPEAQGLGGFNYKLFMIG